MDLTPYVSSLRNALAAAGQAATDDVREAADRLSYAVEPALRLTLIEAFGDAAAEVTTQLDGLSIDVRIRGGNPEFVASEESVAAAEITPPSPPEPPAPPAPPDADQNMSRISLRLPENLKERVEAAAAAEGLSVNGWLIRAIYQMLDGGQRGIQVGPQGVNINLGRRVTGWAR